ncbi:hypothetical protein [Alkalicoccus urumqiensis]|uniref:hypothetical protein n=1 Tax=Alkalicoccus urumqiensis TaxID=1548213 RepID=UPI0015E60B27|nr:hypothetical protein [Alkalicoccus urumqiensis]
MEKWYVFHEVDVRALVTDVERRFTNVQRGVTLHSPIRSGRFFERRRKGPLRPTPPQPSTKQ